jgi:hypothetical protein
MTFINTLRICVVRIAYYIVCSSFLVVSSSSHTKPCSVLCATMGVEGTTDENSNIPSNVSLSLSLSLSLSHTSLEQAMGFCPHPAGFISSKLHDTKIMNGLDDIES